MTIKICAKCSDLFSASLIDDEGKVKGEAYSGYVPNWMPGDGGDYVELDIDAATGRILNWKRPTSAALSGTFKYTRGVRVGKKVEERI
jgi:hypothetical protein